MNRSAAAPPSGLRHLGMVLIALLLLAAVWAGLGLGGDHLRAADLWRALVSPDLSREADVVLWQLRLPRLLTGLICGAALGLSGALLQSMTRNPLADPGILGVNAGAALAVVTLAALGVTAPGPALAGALGGALVAALAVLGLGGAFAGRAHPLRLLLAGAAVSALCLALVKGVVVESRAALEGWRFWVLGALDRATPEMLMRVAPLLILGLIAGIWAALRLNALALGQDIARSLGQKAAPVQIAVLVAVTCLTAACVSLAGPLGFIGLVAPHLARLPAGPSEAARAFWAALIGAGLLVGADLLVRLALPHSGLEAGVATAMIGAPALLIGLRRIEPR